MHPVAFTIFVLSLVFFLYQVVGGVLTFLLVGIEVTEANADSFRWLTLFGQILLLLVPTIVLTRIRHAGEHNFFRFSPPDTRMLGLTIIGVFSLQQVLQGYLLLQDSIPLPEALREVIDRISLQIEETYRILIEAHSAPELLLVMLVVAVVPAITEELLFRGLIQRNIEKSTGGLRAAFITGVVFAAFHLNPFTLVALAALGIYFGYVVYRSNNITLAILAHFFNNGLAVFVYYAGFNEDFVALSPAEAPAPEVVLANSGLFLVIFSASVMLLNRISAAKGPQDFSEGPA
jgi:hypothetical protein